MDFISSIKNGFRNYATFAGRASRSEYWFWQLFTFLVGIALSIVSGIDGVDANGDPKTGVFTALSGLVSLGLFLPTLSVLARRLHDIGKSAWHIVYWGVLPALAAFPLMVVGFIMIVDGALDGSGMMAANVGLGMALFGLGFVVMVGLGTVLFVFTLLDSKPANKYGPSPKAPKGDEISVEGTTA